MAKIIRDLLLDNSINEFSDALAKDTLKLIEIAGQKKNLSEVMTNRFITNFIQAIVLNSLTKYDNEALLTNEEAYKYTKAEFLNTKTDIQNAVSTAFENAFFLSINKKIEYYCLVTLVPESINKDPC